MDAHLLDSTPSFDRPLAGAIGGAGAAILLVAVILLPLVGALLARASTRAGRWLLGGAILGALGLAGLSAGGPSACTPWQPLSVPRVALTLVATPLPVLLVAAVAALSLWALRAPGPVPHARLVQLTCAAAALVLLADSWLLVLPGWEVLALAPLALSAGPAPAPQARLPLALGRGADLVLFGAVALSFWALGGAWSAAGRGFVPDVHLLAPPDGGAPIAALGPTLSIAELTAQLQLLAADGRPLVAGALHDKLFLGRPLHAVLAGAFLLAALLKILAGLAHLAVRRAGLAVALACGSASVAAGAHLLARLRGVFF